MMKVEQFPPTRAHGTVAYLCPHCQTNIVHGDPVLHLRVPDTNLPYDRRDIFTHAQCVLKAFEEANVDVTHRRLVNLQFERLRDEIIRKGTLFVDD